MVIKRHKIIKPFLTDSYSSTSVSVVMAIFRIAATSFHSAIHAVFGRKSHIVRCTSFKKFVHFVASARLRSAASNVVAMCGNDVSTSALAFPKCSTSIVSGKIALNDSKTAKRLTRYIDDFRHLKSFITGLSLQDSVAGWVMKPSFRDTSLATLYYTTEGA